MVFAGIVTLVIALALKYTLGWRIEAEEEETGVDVSEHRESGYDLAAQSGMRAHATMIGSTNNSTAPTIPPRTDVKE